MLLNFKLDNGLPKNKKGKGRNKLTLILKPIKLGVLDGEGQNICIYKMFYPLRPDNESAKSIYNTHQFLKRRGERCTITLI